MRTSKCLKTDTHYVDLTLDDLYRREADHSDDLIRTSPKEDSDKICCSIDFPYDKPLSPPANNSKNIKSAKKTKKSKKSTKRSNYFPDKKSKKLQDDDLTVTLDVLSTLSVSEEAPVRKSSSEIIMTPQGIPIHKPEHISGRRPLSHEVLPCKDILKTLKNLPEANPFLSPVDPIAQNLPDYYIVITEPMDLGTITKKLRMGVYDHIDDFAADVRLTFKNAMKYNPPRNMVHVFAKTLLKYFDDKIKELYHSKCTIHANVEKRHNYWNDKREWIDFQKSIFELQEEAGIAAMQTTQFLPLSFEEKCDLSNKLEEVEGVKQQEVLEFLGKQDAEGDVFIDLDDIDDEVLAALNSIVSRRK
ncbi:bromodomain containing protein, putative [Entamoeba invadens IP1]|uniref:Bromodomain containing protein, putative n=1 Tax=Entamoeba invadens IP1 TaxID=370355 RepID=A0A0A1TZ93_ENTIV|nr:bromodomain containing protein, putative [Entamoeba invadens IP1]ELP86910.1 bromodomain containing protein, putative [Entamoeba invadens IP1]|eukprot:XP_004253681.1 bromodomain containing protein, putative [Entamoeba invadens IP1]